MKRSTEQLETEIEYIVEATERFFASPVTSDELSEMIKRVIEERKGDYLFQRYRDWDSIELLRLGAAFLGIERRKQEAIQPEVVEQPSQDGEKQVRKHRLS